jgi:hypothetical protein
VLARRLLVVSLALGTVGAGSLTAFTSADSGLETDLALARAAAADATAPAPVSEDRYTIAGGCFAARAANGKYLARSGSAYAATAATAAAAEPLRFQALDLGKYLLYGTKADYLAAAASPVPNERPATRVVEGAVLGAPRQAAPVTGPAKDALSTAVAGVGSATGAVREEARGTGTAIAAEPSGDSEWVVKGSMSSFSLELPVDDGEPENPGPVDPAIRGTLAAAADGTLSVVPGKDGSAGARFALVGTTGCAVFPEADLDVSGPVAGGSTPYGETRGYMDAHLHMMAFEFIGGKVRCGRPWHPYGIAKALVDCDDHGPGGRGSLLEDAFSGKNPGSGHATDGYPTFTYWPQRDSLTHEQVYYRWLERAHRGGLRMFTNLLVDNAQLCEVYPLKKNSCNEMDGVRLQAQRLRELERYIDAQAGGPGKGFFRIVLDPFEARRVVNAGKLAVVMGIETSVPLDCREYLGMTDDCDAQKIDQRMQEVYDLGVRQMEMTNKYDNGFTGVTGDDGTTGAVVNTGNKGETGHYWKMGACETTDEHEHDKLQPNVIDDGAGGEGRDEIFGEVLKMYGATGTTPVYGPGPHCNAIGMTELGSEFLKGMVKRGMIFDPDHMSAKARRQALDELAKANYSGIVSSHTWSDETIYKRILGMGGVVTPHAKDSSRFAKEEWPFLRDNADDRWTFGIGFGSDVNGFSRQGNPPTANKLTYPLAGFGGAVVEKSSTGTRTWDYNVEGLDHYGLYADWAVHAIASASDPEAFRADLERGVETYLQMWERAIGVKQDSCRDDVADVSEKALQSTRGATPEAVLLALGQPAERIGDRFTYCTKQGEVAVVFGADERVESIDRTTA